MTVQNQGSQFATIQANNSAGLYQTNSIKNSTNGGGGRNPSNKKNSRVSSNYKRQASIGIDTHQANIGVKGAQARGPATTKPDQYI